MNNSYLLSFLSQRNISTITRKRHAYLTYCGLEQQYTYILKEGVVKTSIILKDGREFNIAYLKGPNIISLLRDEISSYTSNPSLFSVSLHILIKQNAKNVNKCYYQMWFLRFAL